VEKELRARTRDLGLEQQVRILPFTDQPDQYFKRAAIFVLPADIVFCNNSLLEAMAMGVVPIVANVEGADLIVENDVSGYVVERDSVQIAEKIIALLRNDELRRKMAQAAREVIKTRFNSEHTAQALLQFYRNEVWRD
jgi:glycosyltransferase involved in cell wall biosynthesis